MVLSSSEDSSSERDFSGEHSKRKVTLFDHFGFCYVNFLFMHFCEEVDDEFCWLADVVEALKLLKPMQRACV